MSDRRVPGTPARMTVHDVQLGQALRPIDTSDVDAVHLTVFDGPVPLARVMIPSPGAVCSTERIALHLEPYRVAAQREALRANLVPERTAPGPAMSIVVCTRHRPEQLELLLASLARLQPPSSEVIVVDNGLGTDATAEVVGTFGFRYVHEPVAGLDRARNRGLLAASGEVVAFVDDDVSVDPDWARWLAGGFDDPSVMAVTGLVLPAELDTQGQIEFETHAGFIRTMTPFVLDGSLTPPAGAGRSGSGASMAFRRAFLLAVGGFDECLDAGRATRTGGDTYALYQVLDAGYRVRFEPRAVARHRHRSNRSSAVDTVAGYSTGVVAYLLQAALRSRTPAPAWAALRWTLWRVGVLARLTLVASPGIRTTYERARVRGGFAAPLALARARRQLVRHPPLIPPGVTSMAAPEPRPPVVRRNAAPPRSATAVSVIIPTRGERTNLVELVHALSRQSHPLDRLEVIVVTDGPIHTEAELARRLGTRLSCRVIVGGHGGPGPARNRGAAAARGEVLLFLDDDVRPLHDHLVAAHLAAHDDGADAVVGPIWPTSGAATTLTMTVRNWWSDQARHLLSGDPVDMTDVCSGNLSIRRSTFLELGGFGPFPRREDHELALRMAEHGLDVRVAPDAGIWHDPTTTPAGAVQRRWQEGRGDVLIANHHPTAIRRLPLGALDELGGRHGRQARAALRRPTATRLIARSLPFLVSALDRTGSRRYLLGLHGAATTLAYWSGVGSEADGPVGLRALLHSAPPVRRRRLDLLDPLGWAPPTVYEADEVEVAVGDEVLGTASLHWAGTPFDRGRFMSAVIDRFAPTGVAVPRDTPASCPT